MIDRNDISNRKWTLFGLTLAAIVIQIIVIIVGVSLSKNLDRPYNNTLSDKEWEDTKKLARNIVISSGVISIAIQMLGLFGSYKENYCLVLTYAILMTFACLATISTAMTSPIAWLSFGFYVGVTVVAYLFAQDIKRMRNVQFQNGWVA